MSRIDASPATQIADANRPAQSLRDGQDQATQARTAIVPPADAGQSEAAATAETLRGVAAHLKQVIQSSPSYDARELKFDVDKGSGDSFLTIIDQRTGEVVRQIPSKEVLKLRANIDQLIGIIFDKHA